MSRTAGYVGRQQDRRYGRPPADQGDTLSADERLSLCVLRAVLLVGAASCGIALFVVWPAGLLGPFEKLAIPVMALACVAGIGLYVVKALVDRHRGTIAVDTGPCEGTRVTIRLPGA